MFVQLSLIVLCFTCLTSEYNNYYTLRSSSVDSYFTVTGHTSESQDLSISVTK